VALVIQRAEHRDTQAIHAKLDELLRASAGANDGMASIDNKDAEEVENLRSTTSA
jgi:low affinity Fe/Cu permease